jgi:hypothetical protein
MTPMVDIPAAIAAELNKPLAEPISLISATDLTDDERAAIPPWWLEAAEMPDRQGILHALRQWEDAVPGLLPQFKKHVAATGVNLYLGRSEANPVLAYVLAGTSAPILWFGYPPTTELPDAPLDLRQLPAPLRQLYSSLHDGFKQATAFENGFPVSSELFPVSQYGSAEEFEIEGDRVPDLNRLVPIFFDWAAASICVELSPDPQNRIGWHWSEASLRPYHDFWEMLDNWIVSLLTES